MKKTLFTLFLLSNLLFAQDPADIEWKQIQTNQYKIIFPEEISDHANRVANRLEYVSPKIGFHLQEQHKPISLVLSNRSIISNGYVTMFPYKSEWYSLPYTGKSIFVGDWHNMLSLHETRHIHQYTYLNQGFIKMFGYLFGDYGRGIAMNLMVPSWFKEGDAILVETLFSNSGRGRIANFQQNYRTILLTEPKFKYETARFGSYIRPTPDDYEIGYFMTSFIARKYGYEKWSNILNKATWFSFQNPFSPMSASIEQFTDYGGSKKLFYGVQEEMRSTWQNQDDLVNPKVIYTYKYPDDIHFTDDIYPFKNEDGKLYYLKSSFAFGTAVYYNYKKIVDVPHSVKTYGINIKNEKIVWCQYSEDRRWNKLSWSDIIVYDINTRKMKKLSDKSRYFMPAISNDGKKIATVEFTDLRHCNIVILDATNGEILQKIPSPDDEMVHYPSWSPDDKKLVFTSTGVNGRAINEIKLNNYTLTQLTNYNHEDLYRPKYWKDYILYESGYSGIDNIYALNQNTKEKFQITSRRFGAGYPMIQVDNLFFSDYTSKGYKVAEIQLFERDFIPIKQTNMTRTDYFKPLLNTDFQPIEEKDIPQKQYEITDYTGFGRICNPHSYSLLLTPLFYGGIVQSDNILETMSQTIYFLKDIDDDDYIGGVHFDYLGLYPRISTRITMANRVEQEPDYHPYSLNESWKEFEFSLYTEWPLFRKDFGVRTSIASLNLGAGYKKLFVRKSQVSYNIETYDYAYKDKSTLPIYISVNALSIRQKSLQELVPTYSQLSLYTNHTIGEPSFEGIQKGLQFTQGLNLGFNYGLIVDFMAENIEDNGYDFKKQIEPMPVFNSTNNTTNAKFTMTLKRHLWFPDIDFLWCLYVKRFYATFMWEEYGNFFESQSQTAFGFGFTTEFGGIATIKANFPLTIYYYYNAETETDGFRFSVGF